MGGTSNGVNSLDFISEYKNDAWAIIGTLRHPRQQHSAIFNGREIMIIGGKEEGPMLAEIWDKNFENNRVIFLEHSIRYLNPVVFMVPYDFH